MTHPCRGRDCYADCELLQRRAHTTADEASNAAVAAGAAMARAVIAAEAYRTTGELPSFASPDRKD